MWKRRAPNWNEVDLSVLNEALSTGRMSALTREQMPPWARSAPSVTGAWFAYHGGEPLGSTTDLSTGVAHAHMIVERHHQRAPHFRYDQHLFVKMADGRIFQAGPYKDVDFGHHHESRPDWLDEYYSGSTG
jgi:hypothetical protein